MNGQVISKEKFIHKLKKETALNADELAHINENWQWYVTAAESILPRITKVGFFSSREKKLAVYDQVVNLVNEYRLNEGRYLDKIEILQLVVEYSSSSFAHAAKTHINAQVDKISHPNTSRSKNILIFILCLSFWAILGDLATSGSVRSFLNYHLNEYEATAKGVIIRSELWYGMRGGSHYNISYSYAVDEYDYYVGKRVNFYKNVDETAEAAVDNYPVGKEVTVYYEKTNPKYAVLEKTSLGGGIWFDLLGILFITSMTYYVFRT